VRMRRVSEVSPFGCPDLTTPNRKATPVKTTLPLLVMLLPPSHALGGGPIDMGVIHLARLLALRGTTSCVEC
jgi:hypothetical protein